MGAQSDNGNSRGTGDNTFSFDSDPIGDTKPVTGSKGTSGAIDPASLSRPGSDGGSSAGTGSDTKRGRGRPKGSGSKQREKASSAPLDLGFVTFALLGIHTALSASLQIQELSLSEEEATNLAKAIGNVSAHYPVAIDPKTQAWLGLIFVAGSTYIPRVIAYAARQNTEEKAVPPNHLRTVM